MQHVRVHHRHLRLCLHQCLRCYYQIGYMKHPLTTMPLCPEQHSAPSEVRGIGAAIKETLVRAGAHVTIVARSAAGENGIAAHLDTVAGCRKFIAEASAAGVAPYDYLVFTVGAWPDFSDPFTADGVDKVVALDLLARHLVLEGLAKAGLLNQGGRVLNVLASAQNVPRLTEEGLKARVTCSDG